MISIEYLIKIIVGAAVIVAVVGGVYLIFRYNIFDFFKNLGGEEPAKIILRLVK